MYGVAGRQAGEAESESERERRETREREEGHWKGGLSLLQAKIGVKRALNPAGLGSQTGQTDHRAPPATAALTWRCSWGQTSDPPFLDRRRGRRVGWGPREVVTISRRRRRRCAGEVTTASSEDGIDDLLKRGRQTCMRKKHTRWWGGNVQDSKKGIVDGQTPSKTKLNQLSEFQIV
ncbi:uncharacterized protein CIMG_03810 [Coccidioides immitis RS]|uniref:Uncharacterized protein n=1 Tax=Coccidioides immitis (strain RS) TaxID=246410 RepID=J3KC57_COCIM|nr:uncharacterized protein CIMG_03810 [Coccidioides immitis RS]EAS32786.3 hypothetical protein CIMG_03810 [Coccidioides immitis RS]